ncbi:MAG: hypothetical protein ABI401_15775 [Candidatus Dormibacter sp.]
MAALVAVGVLMAGLAAGVPFLRARIPEVFLYSTCCLSAVVLHAGLDLSVRGVRRLVRAAPRTAPAPAVAVPAALEPASA